MCHPYNGTLQGTMDSIHTYLKYVPQIELGFRIMRKLFGTGNVYYCLILRVFFAHFFEELTTYA